MRWSHVSNVAIVSRLFWDYAKCVLLDHWENCCFLKSSETTRDVGSKSIEYIDTSTCNWEVNGVVGGESIVDKESYT